MNFLLLFPAVSKLQIFKRGGGGGEGKEEKEACL